MGDPTIAVLLAVYDPPRDWLAQLLDSLNGQTYPSLRVYVRDDASPHCTKEELSALLSAHLTRVPYVQLQNERNLGSNKTFEQLVRDASEPYIAFCDQDDIWLPDKLETSMRLLSESPLSPTLVCANVSVIDGEGNELSPSITQHRRRHVFLRGQQLGGTFLYRNYVMGCTVVMERARALSYLPFPDAVVHDHYLAFRAACDGAIDYTERPLMRYRIYGGNQTGVMVGVSTKTDYKTRRIDAFSARLNAFTATCPANAPVRSDLEAACAWRDARVANYERKKGSFKTLWRLRHHNKAATLFELVALRLPAPLFRLAVRLVQKRIL